MAINFKFDVNLSFSLSDSDKGKELLFDLASGVLVNIENFIENVTVELVKLPFEINGIKLLTSENEDVVGLEEDSVVQELLYLALVVEIDSDYLGSFQAEVCQETLTVPDVFAGEVIVHFVLSTAE